MTAKEYLSQVRRLDVLINQRIQQKNELRGLTGPSAVRYAVGNARNSLRGDASFVRVVEKICKIEEEIDKRIDEYLGIKNRIISEIQTLPDPIQIQLLYNRYIAFMRFEEIAANTNYSYKYVRNLHGRALQAFENQFPEKFQKDVTKCDKMWNECGSNVTFTCATMAE